MAEEQVGKYELIEAIGQGRLATVHRARPVDAPDGPEVALKVLCPELTGQRDFANEFVRDAQALTRLHHPHILPVQEVDQENGRPYIVMGLVAGKTLADEIAAQGQLSWETTLAMLKPLCSALDHAHSQDVVHHDLKPANVLLDAERGPLLADFGIARWASGCVYVMDACGGVVRTPAYTAPEVWEWNSTEPAVDLYALGCMTYEMLTGAACFDAPTPEESMRKHAQGPQLPDQWPPGVPSGTKHVLEKALARDPAARYASAERFWHALKDAEKQAIVAKENQMRAAQAARWREATLQAIDNEEWSEARIFVGLWLDQDPQDARAVRAQKKIERKIRTERIAGIPPLPDRSAKPPGDEQPAKADSTPAGEWFKKALGPIADQGKRAFTTIADWIKPPISTVTDRSKQAFKAVADGSKHMPSKVSGLFAGKRWYVLLWAALFVALALLFFGLLRAGG
jgi:serine/threonine protein kinase